MVPIIVRKYMWSASLLYKFMWSSSSSLYKYLWSPSSCYQQIRNYHQHHEWIYNPHHMLLWSENDIILNDMIWYDICCLFDSFFSLCFCEKNFLLTFFLWKEFFCHKFYFILVTNFFYYSQIFDYYLDNFINFICS